jgi:putative Mg2+ transporter-C (MgtC) family protein
VAAETASAGSPRVKPDSLTIETGDAGRSGGAFLNDTGIWPRALSLPRNFAMTVAVRHAVVLAGNAGLRRQRCSVQFIKTFQLYDFLDTLVSLFVAFVLGTLIGAERQYRQRSAGLRTNVLVCVGAAAFVDIGNHLTGRDGSVRVIAYVVSGIGFLGAGAIMKEGMNVRGLNTAATLWASAAVGCCAGADLVAQSFAVTFFVLAGNTLLRPLVNAIDRIPLDEKTSEASYQIVVTTDAARAAEIRDVVNERLDAANYPVRESRTIYRSIDNVEVVALLVSLAVESEELDSIVTGLSKLPGVSHATWNVSALE